jgi:predicted nucleic acid-binding protein
LHKGYLLDTSVVSALAPGRETFVPATLGEWLQAHHEALFLPSIAIAEMAQGISFEALQASTGAPRLPTRLAPLWACRHRCRQLWPPVAGHQL